MYLELEPVFEREGAELRFDYAFGEEDPAVASDLHVKGRAFNKTGVVRLEAEASYTHAAACARCGKPLRTQKKVPVSHILLTRLENENDDDDLYIVADRMHLDLDALVWEDVLLSMPSRTLCRPDCKGLCSVCGADLNEGPCACKKETDPRWDALKALME